MKDGELGRTCEDGEIIFREGDKGDGMYVIQAGKVGITKSAPVGEVTLAVLTAGDIFGEMALFDGMPRSASATALGDARILSVDKRKLFTLISKDPTTAFNIIESMSRRIRNLSNELLEYKLGGS